MRYDKKFLWLKDIGFCFVNDNGDDNDDSGGGGGGNDDDDDDKNDIPPEKLKEALKNARKLERTYRAENKTVKQQLEALQKEKKEREDAEKTELEKLQSSNAELQEKLSSYEKREREASLRSAIAEIAKAQGAIYPEDIYDLVSAKLEVDRDGKVNNADDVIKTFKTNRPALFTSSNIDQNQQNRDNGSSSGVKSMNDILRRR